MIQATQRPIVPARHAPDRRRPRISAYTSKYTWKMFPIMIQSFSIRFEVLILRDLRDRTAEDPLAMLSLPHDRSNSYQDTAPLQLTRLGILDKHLDAQHCSAKYSDQAGE